MISSNSKKKELLKPRIAVVAGEKSGDELGKKLIHSLKGRYPKAKFFGVGGQKMISEGLESCFDMDRISVMGITEPLLKIFDLLSLRRQLKKFLLENKPDIYIGIDSPDFNLPIAKFLKLKNKTKAIQYVGPSIWAWRQGRLKNIEKYLDKVLVLFPFEIESYKDSKLEVSFVGHPLAYKYPDEVNKLTMKKKFSIDSKLKVVALLPGSRKSEVAKILPVLLETATEIRENDKKTLFFMPFANYSQKAMLKNPEKYNWINFSVGNSQEVLSFSDIGIVTSGTAVLEAALLKTPSVVVYKTNWLTYKLVRPLLKISFYSLPNLLAGKEILPELIQDQVTSSNVLKAFYQLDQKNYNETLKAFKEIHSKLKSKGPDLAAESVVETLSCL